MSNSWLFRPNPKFGARIYEVWSESNAQGKIIQKRYKLESWRKNKNMRYSYSQYDCFWEKSPSISRSAASAGPITVLLATPSSQNYDSGGRFHRRDRQGWKKSAVAKLTFVECVWGQIYVIQPNRFPYQICQKLKNRENDEKLGRFCGFCRRHCLESKPAKLLTQPKSQRLWLSFSRFSSRKVQDCHPRTGFC